jgi:hypothetical protein
MVGAYIERAAEARLTWAEAESLTEAQVEGRLFKYIGRSEPKARAAIDFDWLHSELPRTGATLHFCPGTWVTGIRPTWVTLRDPPVTYPCPTRHRRPNEPELRSFVIEEAEMDVSDDETLP